MAEGGVGRVPSYERQSTEEVADLPLKIPVRIPGELGVLNKAHLFPLNARTQVSAVYEHFQCIICMSRIESACITPCGHRFCQKCIEECINRRYRLFLHKESYVISDQNI